MELQMRTLNFQRSKFYFSFQFCTTVGIFFFLARFAISAYARVNCQKMKNHPSAQKP